MAVFQVLILNAIATQAIDLPSGEEHRHDALSVDRTIMDVRIVQDHGQECLLFRRALLGGKGDRFGGHQIHARMR